jgi:hypothetical protein
MKESKSEMKRSLATFALLTVLVLACTGLTSFAQDQDHPYPNPTPHFVAGPQHPASPDQTPGKQLVQWNGSFTDLTHKKITFTMVGTDPSKTNVTTTTTVWVIPIKFVFDKSHGNKTFDPQHKLSNGNTVTQNTVASPLFQSGIDFKIGPTDLGNTQYIDAFQRGTWWGKDVKKNTKYHVLMKAVTKPEQTINCTDSSCTVGSEFGVTVGLADINYYDAQVQAFMTKLKATPDVLPFFIFYDTYLTSGGCCIGGYHNANGGQPGGQTYSNAAYVDKVGAFSQDVSAMSHELGEWMDDPFVDNNVNCNDNSILEVGDPLERMNNFGAFPYKLNGFTYNLQSLVFIGYFGAPRTDSANKWLAFQNDEQNVCPGQ